MRTWMAHFLGFHKSKTLSLSLSPASCDTKGTPLRRGNASQRHIAMNRTEQNLCNEHNRTASVLTLVIEGPWRLWRLPIDHGLQKIEPLVLILGPQQVVGDATLGRPHRGRTANRQPKLKASGNSSGGWLPLMILTISQPPDPHGKQTLLPPPSSSLLELETRPTTLEPPPEQSSYYAPFQYGTQRT